MAIASHKNYHRNALISDSRGSLCSPSGRLMFNQVYTQPTKIHTQICTHMKNNAGKGKMIRRDYGKYAKIKKKTDSKKMYENLFYEVCISTRGRAQICL